MSLSASCDELFPSKYFHVAMVEDEKLYPVVALFFMQLWGLPSMFPVEDYFFTGRRRSFRISPTLMVSCILSKYSIKGITYLRDTPVISLN